MFAGGLQLRAPLLLPRQAHGLAAHERFAYVLSGSLEGHKASKACERYGELSPLRKLLDRVEDKVTVLGYTMDAGDVGRRRSQ